MIFNKTKKIPISKQELRCKNVFSQARGLMFRKKKQNLIMIFKKERFISLHNFFVSYPTEILILDKNKKVVEINNQFKPFTFYNPEKKGKYVIELGKDESKGKVTFNDYLKI